ncbi:proteasome-activating nucleotidase, putative [Babesia ovata]|uniref:Proteasome-activating nucleotidase, putative n=1 Tax=Babesia ovata TaxID=189622 RepID=A0A2H6KI30_9APIC|nr:proteasome-activating nucleotidase, putative [Babesia ovata]GBE62643.1 proteasome-activating nucleotidase, putative [Babesia ovata]
MRSTWLNLRKAVTEINSFTHLLYSESDDDGAQPQPATHLSEGVQQLSHALATSDHHQVHGQSGLESAEQRMRMINTLGKASGDKSDDVLGDFTTQLISQYEHGFQPGGGTFSKSPLVTASASKESSRSSAFQDAESMKIFQFGDFLNESADTPSSVAVSCRLYLLYKMCLTLESLWMEIEGRVRDATGSPMFVPPMQRPSCWQKCHSVHNEQTEKILSWLERSLHTMAVLSRTLGIDASRIYEGPSVLLASVNELEPIATGELSPSSHSSTAGGAQEETPGEYMRLIKYISKMQVCFVSCGGTQSAGRLRPKGAEATGYPRCSAREGYAVDRARKTGVPCAHSDNLSQVESLQERIEQLEGQLAEKRDEVKQLTDSLLSANAVNTQLVQKNEQLIATNQRLLMTKSDFLDKDTANKMIQQYYEQERAGNHRREDIIRILESMLGIEPPAATSQIPPVADARTLANQFIEFLDEET